MSSQPQGASQGPISYFTGAPIHESVDLQSDAFGRPWGQARSWTGLNEGGQNGNGWMTTSLPYLNITMNQYYGSHGGILSVVTSGGSGLEFTVDSGVTTLNARYSTQSKMEYVAGYSSGGTNYPGEFRLTDDLGNVTVFYDVSRDATGPSYTLLTDPVTGDIYPPMSQNQGSVYTQMPTDHWFDPADGTPGTTTDKYRFGAFKSYTDASGKFNVSTTYDATTGDLTGVIRTDGSGVFERFLYEYATVSNDVGGSAELISKVSMQKGSSSGGPWTTIRSAEYTYYDGATTSDDNAHGRLGDLKLVVIKDHQRVTLGEVIDQKYYRYNKLGSASYYTVAGPTNGVSTTGGSDTTFFSPGNEATVMSGLKSVFEDAAFARLAANLGSLSSFDDDADSAVRGYADFAFRYERIDPGQSGYPAVNGNNTVYRVIQETVSNAGCSTCSGGFGTYKFDYTIRAQWDTYNYGDLTNSHLTNIWHVKTTEYLPDTTNADTDSDGIVDSGEWDDNDQQIIYSNEIGQVMLKVVLDRNGTTGTSDDQQYLTYYRYDDQSRLTHIASPSALTGYDDGEDDLVDWSSTSSYVRQDDSDSLTNDGLIDIFEYATTTTSGLGEGESLSDTHGDVAGYLKTQMVSQGFPGASNVTTVRSQTYYKHTYQGSSVYPVARVNSYWDVDKDSVEDAQETKYVYAWRPDSGSVETNKILSQIEYHPAVAAARNGSGTSDSAMTVYDADGRVTWYKDEDARIHYTEYDNSTGVVKKRITDVDTDLTGDFSNLPSGWSNSSGLHLKTDMLLDGLGRVTKQTDPNGNVTHIVYIDSGREVRVYRSATGTFSQVGPVSISREYWPVQSATSGQRQVYREQITSSVTPSLTSGVPNGTETLSAANIQSLSRQLTNDAGQGTDQDMYTSLGSATYSQAVPRLTGSGLALLTTKVDYDARGRVKRVESPDGTINRTLYDARGLMVSTWKGTDDTPTSGFWSPTNNDAGNGANMVKVASSIYDASGNMTTSRQVLTHSGNTDSTYYESTYKYDFRNRLVAALSPDGVQTSYQYDTAGHIVATGVDAGVTTVGGIIFFLTTS